MLVGQLAKVYQEKLAGFSKCMINPMDLNAWEAESKLPAMMRKRVELRVFMVGSGNHKSFEDFLNTNFYLGEEVDFKLIHTTEDTLNTLGSDDEVIQFNWPLAGVA